ncbi:two-component regulator propeller domain-containing protein [Sphingopyxis sp. CCNWLW253]|uniref:sensor histidine kinase n=1 Tax=unclassified Sphingopyxis TaxID=2614943 RepID=UPI0030131A7D
MLATLVGLAPAWALDPTRNIAQYTHTRWTSAEDGAPDFILSLAQGRDGYLWIGARDGLFRFDGISFERISPARPRDDRTAVSALMVARDGTVWVGYSSGGIETYRGGKLRDAGVPNARAYVISFAQTADGAIWTELGGVFPHLMRYQNGGWRQVGASWGLPQEHPIDILAARDGTLWLTTLQSVYSLPRGTNRFRKATVIPIGHAALSEDAAGQIWLTDAGGTRAVAPRRLGRFLYPTPPAPRAVGTLFDRDGNLWGITGPEGIFRVLTPDAAGESSSAAAAARVSVIRESDGLTSNLSPAVLEDHEGNIWVGTALGLDRFRDAHVAVEPLLSHIPAWGDVLLGASDGSVYVGGADRIYRIRPRGMPDVVLDKGGDTEALCEGPDGVIWMVTARRLVRFHDNRRTDLPRPSSEMGFNDCAVDRHGALWLTDSGGLYRQKGTGWTFQALLGGDGTRARKTLIAKRDGSLLVSVTTGSLRRIDFPRQTEIGRARPLRDLRTMYEGSDGVLLGGGFGLARLRGESVRLLDAEQVPAVAGLTGISQTPDGETWLMGRRGITRVLTAELDRAFDDPSRPLNPQIFDSRDGLPAYNVREGKRDVVRGGDGRLWFATAAGTVWIDPTRLRRNPIPPPVTVSALRANGVIHRDPTRVTLPSGTTSIEIAFSALSLSIPERVLVRYQLEGAEKHWQNPGLRRQAFYTNLGPGTYRFRVIARNNDGVWNRDGATLEFTIPPTFLQSNWFMLLTILALCALLWIAYSLRLRQVTAGVRAALEARLAERERIARELHDTLLQSFQGLVLRFQAVADRIPPDQPLRPVVEQALDRADAALIEGRDRVRELRTVSGDLAKAITDVAEEMAAHSTTRFALTVEGHPRELHPMVHDEVENVAAEAIRNAFQHARARRIEAILSYRSGELRFDLHDDGVGLPAGLAAGDAPTGHFGLTGMRERALRVGGALTISSRKNAGTEVVLSIPAGAAYVPSYDRRRWSAFLNRWLGSAR